MKNVLAVTAIIAITILCCGGIITTTVITINKDDIAHNLERSRNDLNYSLEVTKINKSKTLCEQKQATNKLPKGAPTRMDLVDSLVESTEEIIDLERKIEDSMNLNIENVNYLFEKDMRGEITLDEDAIIALKKLLFPIK